jgi:mono/diheme cytochrome c family protein
MRGAAALRTVAIVSVALLALGLTAAASSPNVGPGWINQGDAWTAQAQSDFYSHDQGSRMMPLAWMRALKQPSGEPFLANNLARYGYLANPASPAGLPVGFNAAGPVGQQDIGMTCAACHTRQIEVKGVAYRIDGGPALVDFQSFLADLDAALDAVLVDNMAFSNFATAVAGGPVTPDQKALLRQQVSDWYDRYHTLITHSLPGSAGWGVGRADAVQMIFNRLAGLDIGPPPSYVIASNMYLADAPVRYPFLWNVAQEDKTQWMGFAPNGDDTLGLLRNMGEVFGVFADFHPAKSDRHALGIDYWAVNSANLSGLKSLEKTIHTIGPPHWPWAYDSSLAGEGKEIFYNRNEGNCASCHNPASKSFFGGTRSTPIVPVDTDSRQITLLGRTVSPGVLEGASIPIFAATPLRDGGKPMPLLTISVIGSYLQNLLDGFVNDLLSPKEMANLSFEVEDRLPAFVARLQALRPDISSDLANVYKQQQPGYEARALTGIWAAAPYLHNGSVASLADLLKPPEQRAPSFLVGPEYDPVAVGLSSVQPRFSSLMVTTDCTEPGSGNSRCGHTYGTTLSDHQKQALLEYLKAL